MQQEARGQINSSTSLRINGEQSRTIKFGTDGWRAVIADNFTFHNVRVLTQAVCDYINQDLADKPKQVAVGYDTRFLSDKFAETVCEVMAANNIAVSLSQKAVPTPAVSFVTKHGSFALGIVLTASHNPPEFNGFKIKDARGGSADIAITHKVETLLGESAVKSLPLKEALRLGLVKRLDFESKYIKFIKSYMDLKLLKSAKFKILQDVMYGSGSGILEEIIKATPLKLTVMHKGINPSFGGLRPEPVPENLEEAMHKMSKERFDLGLVLDGDADRIAAIEPGGKFISPQQVLALLILHLKEDRKWDGAVVKTIAGTTMIDKITKKLGIKLYETPVGFKYISNLMEEENILVGGEEAGGMGFKNYIPERDGVLAGLLLIEMMAYRKKGIDKIMRDLENEYGKYFYVKDSLHLTEVKFDKEKTLKNLPGKLLNKKISDIKTFDGIKIIFEDEDWLMLRGSGTEPIVRVYAEAKKKEVAESLVKKGKQIILNS